MSRVLFLYSLSSSRGGVIAWSLFFLTYALLMVYLFVQMQQVADILAEYAERFGAMFEVFAGEFGSVLNPDGSLSMGKWLSLEFLALWPLLMSVYAIFYANGIVAREVDRGTMDMLLSQPIKRYSIIISKYIVFPVILMVVALASVVGVLAGMAIVGNTSDIAGVCLAFLPAALIPLAVLSYSLLFSCIFLDPRKVLMAAGSLTGLFYLFNIIARTVDAASWLGYLSIFHYYEPAVITSQTALNWSGIGLYVGIIVIGLVASLYIFQRRDMVI